MLAIRVLSVDLRCAFGVMMTSRAASRNMATKSLRQRNRRGSKPDANNVNNSPTTDSRATKDDKCVEDNNSSDPRNE